MAYIKNTWTDRSVEFPRRYLDELSEVKTFTPNEGTIYNAGTPITGARMNNIETGLEKLDNQLIMMKRKLRMGMKI